MAYVPDKLGERRRAENVSQTACEFFIKYCEHADKETGLTFANEKTCADAFQMRSDNAQKYDRELINKGWVRLIDDNGKIYRKVEAGWLPQSQRQGKAENTEQGKAENADVLNFRKELTRILNFRKSSYILGEIPKFKEEILNFRNAYKEYIDQHINQQLDQLIDHLEETAQGAPPDAPEKKIKLPRDFQISEEMRVWANEKTPNVDIDEQLPEFIEFWCDIATRDNKRTMRGWLATWRKRMSELQKKYDENQARIAAWQKGKQNGHSNGTTIGTNGNGQTNDAHLKPRLISG